jgi:carbon monoxide dehydrogenase subunit G
LPETLEATSDFTIAANQSECWKFFSDFANIFGCIPGFESLEVYDSKNARLKVRASVGFVSKVFDLKVKLTALSELSTISFTGEGNDAEVAGEVRLFSDGGNGTVVNYTLRIKPLSAVGKTAVGMLVATS